MNINCVICSDLFIPADSNIFVTQCGHIFHHACLIQWMERKKDCPQCRQKCTERSIFRIFFNTTTNVDSNLSSANLIETIDGLHLKVRELEMTLKTTEEQKRKLEDTMQNKEKKIKKLDASVSQCNQVISTMKHEIDLLSRNRASYKVIEAENEDLKSKLNLLQTIESVLTASQKEIDDILKHNLSSKELSVMVGTLKRELNNTECRKNEFRKQLQSARNDLRSEIEEKRKLQDELSKLESENNLMIDKFKRIRTNQNDDLKDENSLISPDVGKKSRQALLKMDSQNTPSPLNQSELKRRIHDIQEADSPYFKVKKSSIGLACVLKNPKLQSEHKSNSTSSMTKLSIFKKARISQDPFNKLQSNMVYNGIGGTSKILQSDLKVNVKDQ